MKQHGTKQLRVRLNETQLECLVSFILDHPDEFKNKSEFIRESIHDKLCRRKNINLRCTNTTQGVAQAWSSC
jgi:Arc/MetJ-type ribon-helix-helix transcriptional regulator